MRKAKLYTFDGQTLTAAQWGMQLGITGTAVRARLKSGRPIHLALGYPRSAHAMRRMPRNRKQLTRLAKKLASAQELLNDLIEQVTLDNKRRGWVATFRKARMTGPLPPRKI